MRKIIEKRIRNIAEYNSFEQYENIRLLEIDDLMICRYSVDYNKKEPFSDALIDLKKISDSLPATYGAIVTKFGGMCLEREYIEKGSLYY